MADSAPAGAGGAGSAAAAAAAAASNYKKLKEDFVSNLSGGSAEEVFLVTAVAPVAILVWSVLQRRHYYFRPYSLLAFVVDFFLNAGAILLATTLYAGQPLLLNGLLLALALFILAVPRCRTRHTSRKRPKTQTHDAGSSPTKTAPHDSSSGSITLPKKAYLTTYRGCMMAVTCLAILAVDFRVFPRRFAKVETWGTSLMDMGVGSFVFSGGIVAARPVLKERASCKSPSLAQRLLASLRHSLPLLVLGIVRLLSVKGLDYAEHTSEYGVHWNFFFTLGLLPPFVAVAQAALQVVPSSAALALVLAGVYQIALETTSLKAYVLTAPRVDLVSKNREGLASFVGYLAIFLAGQDTGMYLLPQPARPANSRSSKKDRGAVAWLRRALSANRLPAWAALWFFLHQLSIRRGPLGLGLTESRRLANLPYVLWVLSFNTQQLTMFYLVDRVVFGERPLAQKHSDRDDAADDEAAAYDYSTSVVLRALNRNGLLLFLIANLLTGAVNMSVPTLDVSQVAAMAILLGYGAVLVALAVALELKDITVRL
ncbi:Glucosaminyl phosphatidylinositol (GlcN-PI) nositol acylation protein [Sporothrix epigloea]|uniref:GPI-anchored wall transfer protein n=1 Tax=Sporothrix epigloea TaxID=1892477 RepID=A0ABP0DIQ5_9PEZI